MEFKNNQSGNGGFISLSDNNEELGRLTYTIFPELNKLIISFVLVHKKNEGKGLGKLLVENAVEFARENNYKIYPHCSYARTILNRMDNVDDILLLQ